MLFRSSLRRFSSPSRAVISSSKLFCVSSCCKLSREIASFVAVRKFSANSSYLAFIFCFLDDGTLPVKFLFSSSSAARSCLTLLRSVSNCWRTICNSSFV